MSHITVIGGTGFAGSAIVTEAARRGHQVTALSTRAPAEPVGEVRYVQGDATDERVLVDVLEGADVVVATLAPRGSLLEPFRGIYRTIARLADEAGARLVVVGGFSSLRPAPGEDRYVSDLSDVPEPVRDEVLAGAALILEDLPATPESLDWLFVSPAQAFGAHAPGQDLGRYELGGEVAVQPVDGGAISAADYALGVVDLIDDGGHRREHVNLGNSVGGQR